MARPRVPKDSGYLMAQNMVLATAVDVDRNGNEYPNGVSPDELIAVGDKISPLAKTP